MAFETNHIDRRRAKLAHAFFRVNQAVATGHTGARLDSHATSCFS